MQQLSPSSSLKSNASLLDVVMLGAGSAIGSSIFSVLGPAAKIAHGALLWAIVVAVLPMGLLAIVYAAVASVLPRSGASYEWPRQFIGPRFAFCVAWLRILGSLGMLVTGALVLAKYLTVFTSAPATPTMLVVFVMLYLLNLLGISFAAKAQTAMMVLLMIAFAVFVVIGVPHADWQKLGPLIHNQDVGLMIATLPLLINLFMGIETATEIGEEVHNAKRNVPLGIGLAVALTLIIYVIVTTLTLAIIGIDGVAASDTPLTSAAKAVGGITLPIMLCAALLCLVKSLNVNFMIFARNLYAMGRSGVLPAALARIHPRWGTPYVAATIVFGLTCLGLLLPQDLIYLFIATSIPTLLKYVSTCVCALIVYGQHKDLVAEAHWSLPPTILRVAATLGGICAAGIALAGAATDWRPYALIGAWGIIGIFYWVATGRSARLRAAAGLT